MPTFETIEIPATRISRSNWRKLINDIPEDKATLIKLADNESLTNTRAALYNAAQAEGVHVHISSRGPRELAVWLKKNNISSASVLRRRRNASNN